MCGEGAAADTAVQRDVAPNDNRSTTMSQEVGSGDAVGEGYAAAVKETIDRGKARKIQTYIAVLILIFCSGVIVTIPDKLFQQ